MPRTPRIDYPGAVHHVMNRAIGRRTAFETREDVRFFLSRVGWAVHRSEIRVSAFSILTTHYHLLLRSPAGKLSEAMRRIQNEYVRAFNRKRRRDGPLFRGRFVSRPVESVEYLLAVIHYIDKNAPEARLATSAERYPYGSAFHYARAVSPPWLDRSLVERVVNPRRARGQFDPDQYGRTFGEPLNAAQSRLIESRLAFRRAGSDPLDDLVGAAPMEVRRWMLQRATMADGTSPGLPIASPSVVSECIDELRTPHGEWRVTRIRKSVDLWEVLHAAMLRHACSLKIDDIARRVRISRNTVRAHLRAHQARLEKDEVYASCATSVLARILESSFPAGIARDPRDLEWRPRCMTAKTRDPAETRVCPVPKWRDRPPI